MGVCINRYVGNNEKIQCLDEDSNQNKNLPTESKDKKSQITHQVSMVDNALERDVPVVAHTAVKLPKNLAAGSTNYDKLCLSLLSGLPNEQEFALNVCAILSNDEDNIIRLERVPRLVDILVAQTGIWPEDNDSLKLMYLECWDDLKGRNMYRFWRSTLDLQNKQLVQLIGLDLDEYDPHAELLNLESDQGVINAEGQRVLMVALILHNLSFEKSNVPFLVRRSVFIRFLLLSIHSSWSNLRQTAYDTLANIAYSIELQIEKNTCSRLLFQTVIEGLLSPDRFMSIRSMDILSQLCNLEMNEDLIPSRLDPEMYQQMVSFLTVHDILLLFYALEALYALSDLGKYACDKIASVQGSVGILVSLLTLEPSQYGPSAEIKMKIVEVLVPVEECDLPTTSETPSTSITSTVTVSEKPTISQQPPAASVIKDQLPSKDVTSENFGANWLKANYEYAPGSTTPRNDLYVEYIGFCTKAGRKAVMSANVFANCVKNTFPQCDFLKVQSLSGVVTYHHNGLKKKGVILTPISLQSKMPITSFSNITLSPKLLPKPATIASPILKAQLSSPAITDSPTPTLKQALSQCMTKSKNHILPTTTAHTVATVVQSPMAQTSSTLIKSLLANKVQQRNVQRQIVPQSMQKMVIISPSLGGATGSQNAVMRCIVPSNLSPMNIRTAPIQARIVGNKGCLVATSNPIISSVIQPKALQPKQTVITTAGPSVSAHLNGLKGETSNEVQSQIMTTQDTGEVANTQVIQVNCVQNHASTNSSISATVPCDNINIPSSKDVEACTTSDQNFIISNIQGNTVTYRLAAPNELPVTNSRLFVRSQTTSDVVSAMNDQNGSAIFVNSKNTPLSLMTQSVIRPKVNCAPTSVLKAALSEVDEKTDELRAKLRKEEITKRSPLLNGLLDRGRPSMKGDILFNALVENGIEASDVGLELSNSPPSSQTLQSKVIAAPSPVNSFIIPSSSLNSVIVPTSSFTSGILPFSSSNSIITSGLSTSSISTAPGISFLSNNNVMQIRTAGQGVFTASPGQSILSSSLNMPMSSVSSIVGTSASTVSSAASPVTFLSNGANLVQIRTGQATFSGTAEVQPDQKGVVRLHIESPENSNQGSSDLSSITDIARTLECASEAISRTNAECTTQVPQSNVCSTNSTTTVINTNTATAARPNQQQIIVVTPNLNQSQLQLQSPNIKFCILHTVPVGGEEPMDVIGLPQINLNQLQQQSAVENPSISPISLKRPSSEVAPMCVVTNVKKPRIEVVQNTSPAVTAASVITETVIKPTAVELVKSVSKLITPNAVAVHNVELPSEKESKTFSGLSSSVGHPPPTASPPVQSKSPAKLEFLCEWKNCGLKFPNPGSVLLHASKIHTPECTEDMICQWEGCDSMKRRRLSLLTHLQDWHCNEKILQMQAMRRQQILLQGQSTLGPPPKPPPHPGYAPDAALLAIKRHALQYVNPKELSEEKESALTKSIRLTSGLILRNLVTHSSLARTYVRRYEPELAYLAMSPVESAKAISQCLAHLSGSSD